MLAALGEVVCRACDEFQAPIHGEAGFTAFDGGSLG
jgi:hypothetical protein